MNRIRLAVAGAAVAVAVVTGSAVAAIQAIPSKKVSVKATEYAYKFSSLRSAPGQTVIFALKNAGTEVHDLKFQGVPPKSRFIPGGASTTFKVTFRKRGRYQFFCTIGEHALKGMRGTWFVK